MRDDQRLKLARFKEQLEQAEARKREQSYIRATQSLSSGLKDLSDAVHQMASKEAPVAPEMDLTPIVESISKLKIETHVEPIIKVESPTIRVEPVINIAPTEDISARYRRVNSKLDPEGTYHGFVDANSNWYIQLESTGVGDVARSRYAVGKGTFSQS